MSEDKLKNQKINKSIKRILLIIGKSLFIGLFAYWIIVPKISASEPSSTSYKIESYSFGAGGITNGASATYKLNGVLGEVESGKTSSTNFQSGNGLSFLQTVNVPSAPTFTNPSSYYNKLSITLNTGSNPSDTKFAIAISPNAFVSTTNYVQADDTVGSSPVWQTNTVWGASGFNIIGLANNTTYTVKVSAMQGNFSQSAYGPTASASTSLPSFTFSISPNSVNIGQLIPGSIVTAASTITATVSTNGTNGTSVVVYGTNNGLLSSSTSYTISSSSTDLSSASQGYGIQAGSVNQTSGGPMESLSPFNVSGTNVGGVSTTKQTIFDSTGAPVTSGTGTFSIKAKSSISTKPASDYADTITVIATGTF